jgi:hypothetical protein
MNTTVKLPSRKELSLLLEEVIPTLQQENQHYRPRDEKGRPGGLIQLSNAPVILVPDLHGRIDFLQQLLQWRPPLKRVSEGSMGPHSNTPPRAATMAPPAGAPTTEELLSSGELQIVCVGDGLHSESRGYKRWQKALKEFIGSFSKHGAMDEEMGEGLGLMQLVMTLKRDHPANFHFLKGNHENILNREGQGDHAFRKFAFEGEMVRLYMETFYGEELLSRYAEFEQELPLVAADATFMVSHAEPARGFSREEVIGYRSRPDVTEGLTWTPNDGAQPGSVAAMINEFCSHPEKALYFGGHRVIPNRYTVRAQGRYIQFHNPLLHQIILLRPGEIPDPDQDIIDLDQPLSAK